MLFRSASTTSLTFFPLPLPFPFSADSEGAGESVLEMGVELPLPLLSDPPLNEGLRSMAEASRWSLGRGEAAGEETREGGREKGFVSRGAGERWRGEVGRAAGRCVVIVRVTKVVRSGSGA